jgi:type II secretory pathway pseudopilin PulG
MEKHSSGARIWVIVAAILVVAGVAAFFAGNAVEHAARAQDAKAAEQQYAAAKAQLQGAQTRIASLQSVNQLLTANVWAYRATVALDNRNFGLANDAVVKVVASLNDINATAAGLDGQALKALQTEAANVKISVATNLESLRNQIIQLAADITALAGKSAAGPTSIH